MMIVLYVKEIEIEITNLSIESFSKRWGEKKERKKEGRKREINET